MTQQTLAERLQVALRDGRWKPIESAPKIDCDKGCVLRLGLVDNDDPVVMFWWENQGGWFEFKGKQVFPYMWQNIPVVPGEPDPLLTLIRELIDVVRKQNETLTFYASRWDTSAKQQDDGDRAQASLAETVPLLAVMEAVNAK